MVAQRSMRLLLLAPLKDSWDTSRGLMAGETDSLHGGDRTPPKLLLPPMRLLGLVLSAPRNVELQFI